MCSIRNFSRAGELQISRSSVLLLSDVNVWRQGYLLKCHPFHLITVILMAIKMQNSIHGMDMKFNCHNRKGSNMFWCYELLRASENSLEVSKSLETRHFDQS
ncbi:UNVERIFIED_CONTAM: hypothetical protein NCL1_36858 [Trichonephila clavipes]